MRLTRSSTLSVLAVSVLLLTACADAPANPAPTSPAAGPATTDQTPTPTVDPLTTVDSITLNAETFILRAGSTEIATLPLADTSGTLAALTTVLGDPAVTVTTPDPAHHCTLPNTSYRWGDALSVLTWTSGTPAGFDVRLLAPDVHNASGSRLTLNAFGGVKVGDDISDLIAQAPDSMKEAYAYQGVLSGTLLLQQGYPDRTFATGVVAFTDDSIVTVIGTPVPMHSNQDC